MAGLLKCDDRMLCSALICLWHIIIDTLCLRAIFIPVYSGLRAGIGRCSSNGQTHDTIDANQQTFSAPS